MKHLLAGCEQVVGDDRPMAAPLHYFGAHDGTALRLAELAQMRKAVTETLAHGVVRIVMETLVGPEFVYLGRHLAARLRSPPSAAMCS